MIMALNDITQCSLSHPTSYVIGQVVTLKVTLYGNLRCQELSLDGKAITLDANGNYSFVATKNGHKLVAKYTEQFAGNAEWDMPKQTEGVLSVAAPDGDTGWMATSANTYTHMGIGFTAAGASTAKEGL